MAKGRFEWSVAPVATLQPAEDTLPVLPALNAGVRGGIADGVDLGFAVSAAQVRADARVRLLGTPRFALALAPAAYLAGVLVEGPRGDAIAPLAGAELGLVASLALSERVGIHALAAPGGAVFLDDGALGALARQGIGLRIQITPGFAIHPELIAVTDLGTGWSLVDAAFGLGFVFGSGGEDPDGEVPDEFGP